MRPEQQKLLKAPASSVRSYSLFHKVQKEHCPACNTLQILSLQTRSTVVGITLQEKGLLDKNAARSWMAFLTTTTDLSWRRPTASDTTDWN